MKYLIFLNVAVHQVKLTPPTNWKAKIVVILAVTPAIHLLVVLLLQDLMLPQDTINGSQEIG